ncbi:hypothetical protein [Novosphingobium sp.]|uniref:hypothetical protein n=1 Tax=Novosphingobium sp. TaxID=1874826 RepID=UPI00334215EA
MASTATRGGAVWPRLIALAGFVVAIVAGLLLPVYTDEIGWRFQERAAVDHGVDIAFSDLCGPNSLGHAPWFMMPARWYSAMANQAFADPWFVRVEGVLCAGLWAMLLWWLIVRLTGTRAQARPLHALAFALLGLGLLPFLLVMSRPEQPVMLAMTMAIITAFAPLPRLGERTAAWVKSVVIVLLVTIAASYHLKGVLYAPVALAAIAVGASGRRTWLPRGVGIGLVVTITLAAAHYWVDRFRCTAGDPLLAAHYAHENVASLLTGSHPASGLLLQLASGLNPLNYVALAMADNRPMSHWVPDGLFPPALLIAVNLLVLISWIVVVGLALRALVRFVADTGLRALAQPRVLIALAIAACVMVWGASQLRRNVYEAAHVLPMLVLFAVLCLTLPRRDPDGTAAFPRWLAGAAALFAVISQAALAFVLLPPLIAAARVPGYLDGQPFSVSVGGYAQIRRDIARAMDQAGMPRDRRLNRLLVDDVTYLALQTDTLPLHRLGVLEVWNGSITDPVDYLRRHNSDGVVVGCRYLPPAMRAGAARAGEICAISRDGLARLDDDF